MDEIFHSFHRHNLKSNSTKVDISSENMLAEKIKFQNEKIKKLDINARIQTTIIKNLQEENNKQKQFKIQYQKLKADTIDQYQTHEEFKNYKQNIMNLFKTKVLERISKIDQDNIDENNFKKLKLKFENEDGSNMNSYKNYDDSQFINDSLFIKEKFEFQEYKNLQLITQIKTINEKKELKEVQLLSQIKDLNEKKDLNKKILNENNTFITELKSEIQNLKSKIEEQSKMKPITEQKQQRTITNSENENVEEINNENESNDSEKPIEINILCPKKEECTQPKEEPEKELKTDRDRISSTENEQNDKLNEANIQIKDLQVQIDVKAIDQKQIQSSKLNEETCEQKRSSSVNELMEQQEDVSKTNDELKFANKELLNIISDNRNELSELRSNIKQMSNQIVVKDEEIVNLRSFNDNMSLKLKIVNEHLSNSVSKYNLLQIESKKLLDCINQEYIKYRKSQIKFEQLYTQAHRNLKTGNNNQIVIKTIRNIGNNKQETILKQNKKFIFYNQISFGINQNDSKQKKLSDDYLQLEEQSYKLVVDYMKLENVLKLNQEVDEESKNQIRELKKRLNIYNQSNVESNRYSTFHNQSQYKNADELKINLNSSQKYSSPERGKLSTNVSFVGKSSTINEYKIIKSIFKRINSYSTSLDLRKKRKVSNRKINQTSNKIQG